LQNKDTVFKQWSIVKICRRHYALLMNVVANVINWKCWSAAKRLWLSLPWPRAIFVAVPSRIEPEQKPRSQQGYGRPLLLSTLSKENVNSAGHNLNKRRKQANPNTEFLQRNMWHVASTDAP